MYHTDLSLRIAQEQREKIVAAVESAAVTLFGVVTGALLPQMVYQYMLTSGELIEPPAILTYIPHIGYGLAVIFFVNALVGNYLRSRRIKAYSAELQMMSYMDDCDCEDCQPKVEEEETASLAKALSKADSKTKKAPAKKKAVTKKSTKKTAK